MLYHAISLTGRTVSTHYRNVFINVLHIVNWFPLCPDAQFPRNWIIHRKVTIKVSSLKCMVKFITVWIRSLDIVNKLSCIWILSWLCLHWTQAFLNVLYDSVTHVIASLLGISWSMHFLQWCISSANIFMLSSDNFTLK